MRAETIGRNQDGSRQQRGTRLAATGAPSRARRASSFALRTASKQVVVPHLPAISTVHAVLDRYGLVQRRRRRRSRPAATPLSQPIAANACGTPTTKANSCSGIADALTITDFAMRYLLACEALTSTRVPLAFTA